MENLCETVELVWHKNEHNQPKKDGEYLCEIVDVLKVNGDEVIWSKPYHLVVRFYGDFWDCDGVPVAWAEIPKSPFNID